MLHSLRTPCHNADMNATPAASSARPLELPQGFVPALMASLCASVSISVASGSYHPLAVFFVAATLAILGWQFSAALWPRRQTAPWPRAMLIAAFLGLLVFAGIALHDDVLMYAIRPWRLGRTAQVASLLLLASYIPEITGWRTVSSRLRTARFAAFAVATLLAGVDAIYASPAPRIDVWTLQTQSAIALEHGQNPYTHVATHDTDRGTFLVPFVYPPTQALLSLAGHLLGGDVRFTLLIAMLIAGFCLRSIARRAGWPLLSFVEDAPTLYLWLSPKLFFILEQAWVDPIQLALFAMTIRAHLARRPLLTAALLGLTVSSKQSMLWLIPLGAVLLEFRARQWIGAVVAGAAAAIPFALWDFAALRHAVIDFELSLPPRADALTINAWAANVAHIAIPGAVGTVLAAVLTGVGTWALRRRGVFGLGIASATIYLFFFAFNKWAFANYYFFVLGLAALAASTSFYARAVPALEIVLAPSETEASTIIAPTR